MCFLFRFSNHTLVGMQKTLALFFLGLLCAERVPPRVLYFPTDDVEILDVTNFNYIKNSPTAWLVTFYGKTCKHSHEFAPIWRQFASEAAPWRDIVRVGVVDCSDTKNTKLCDEFKIDSLPTLRYFHEKSRFGANNPGLDISVGINLIFTKRFIFKTIVGEIMKGRGRIYPRGLVPYLHTNSTELFIGEETNTYLVWVIEDILRPLGAEMVMHFHRTPKVSFRRSQPNSFSVFPKIVFADRENSLVVIEKNINGSLEMKQIISDFLKSKGITPYVIIPAKVEKMYPRV